MSGRPDGHRRAGMRVADARAIAPSPVSSVRATALGSVITFERDRSRGTTSVEVPGRTGRIAVTVRL
jgi:hypothetical protein